MVFTNCETEWIFAMFTRLPCLCESYTVWAIYMQNRHRGIYRGIYQGKLPGCLLENQKFNMQDVSSGRGPKASISKSEESNAGDGVHLFWYPSQTSILLRTCSTLFARSWRKTLSNWRSKTRTTSSFHRGWRKQLRALKSATSILPLNQWSREWQMQ